MKLTKGKIRKLYNKKRQSLRKPKSTSHNKTKNRK